MTIIGNCCSFYHSFITHQCWWLSNMTVDILLELFAFAVVTIGKLVFIETGYLFGGI